MYPIHDFSNLNDYLPILNGSLAADIIILLMTYYTNVFNIKTLKAWYEKYRLSAVIADVLILVIGIIIARYFYSMFKIKWNIVKFLSLVLVIQIIHDYLFYLFFKSVPRGTNKMLDLFKDYAKEIGGKAILGDSFMIILAVLLSSYFAGLSQNTNIILCVCLVYLIPYVLYTR